MENTVITGLIENYLEEVDAAIKAAGPADGLFGMRKGPKDDPCHQKFYDAVGEAVAGIQNGDEAFAAASELIRADKKYDCPQMAALTLTAAQNHIMTLLPLLSSEQKDSLKKYFDTSIPRWERLPTQKQLYKALKQ